MKNKNNSKNRKKDAIWFFAGGVMQEVAVKKILERGYKLILSDENPECLCAKYADEFIHADIFDIPGNLKAAKRLRGKYNIQAVFTAPADCHETVAIVAKFLGLPGIDPKIAHLCRYKLEMREVLARAGIPQPKFKRVRILREAKQALKAVGLPAAIKSSNNSGSRGFSKIEKTSDLTEAILKRAIENGTTGYAMLETLLVPVDNEIAEQSVETVWYNGKMYWLNWVDRLFRKDLLLFKKLKEVGRKMYGAINWSVEIGHINPAIHNLELRREVEDMIYRAGIALGMGEEKGGHILKADIMLTKDGPRILEMTPRLSGGWDSSRTSILRGADFINGAISLALGEPLDLELWNRYFRYQNPNLYASILASIYKNAKDCIGRKFSEGSSFEREEALKRAYENLVAENYL